MLVYEITVRVRVDLVKDFEKFMKKVHIPDLIKTGCFVEAELARISNGNYRIRYLTETKESLERYLENDAEKLRKDFIKNFPAGIEVSREILEVLQVWDISN